jgi:hypothetical protein
MEGEILGLIEGLIDGEIEGDVEPIAGIYATTTPHSYNLYVFANAEFVTRPISEPVPLGYDDELAINVYTVLVDDKLKLLELVPFNLILAPSAPDGILEYIQPT